MTLEEVLRAQRARERTRASFTIPARESQDSRDSELYGVSASAVKSTWPSASSSDSRLYGMSEPKQGLQARVAGGAAVEWFLRVRSEVRALRTCPSCSAGSRRITERRGHNQSPLGTVALMLRRLIRDRSSST